MLRNAHVVAVVVAVIVVVLLVIVVVVIALVVLAAAAAAVIVVVVVASAVAVLARLQCVYFSLLLWSPPRCALQRLVAATGSNKLSFPFGFALSRAAVALKKDMLGGGSRVNDLASFSLDHSVLKIYPSFTGARVRVEARRASNRKASLNEEGLRGHVGQATDTDRPGTAVRSGGTSNDDSLLTKMLLPIHNPLRASVFSQSLV